MRKFNLLSLSSMIICSAIAQNLAVENRQVFHEYTKISKIVSTSPMKRSFQTDGSSLWKDDFSDINTWTMGHANGSNLDWQIGEVFNSENPFKSINSTTKSNGYAFLDSYKYSVDHGDEIQSSWMTTASPINLSNNENLVLQFETYHYNFQSKCYVVVSSTNENWPILNPNFDAETDERVYELFEGVEMYEGVKKDPTLTRLNISKVAGGEENVWIRFHWTGRAYAWLIDDVAVINQPSDDIVLQNGSISSDGIEYGRMPTSQINDRQFLSGIVQNFGANNQSNVEMKMKVTDQNNIEKLSTSVSTDLMKKDSTYIMQANLANFSSLPAGDYKVNYTVSSDEDKEGGANFSNNIYERNFQISKDLYSVDGIGVYQSAMLKYNFGTDFFSNNADGLMLMTRYTITEPTKISGLEVGIAPGSKVNGEILPFVISLESVSNNRFDERVVNGQDAVGLSQEVVNETDILKRFVFAPLPSTILQPGTYFAGVELFSDNNQNDVFILDDISIPQLTDASVVYLPNNSELDNKGLYNNGNAFAIRLGLDQYNLTTEEKTAINFSIYPNPSNGMFTLSHTGNEGYTVQLINALGETLSVEEVKNQNKMIDMRDYNPGLYFVKVFNEKAQSTKKIILK